MLTLVRNHQVLYGHIQPLFIYNFFLYVLPGSSTVAEEMPTRFFSLLTKRITLSILFWFRFVRKEAQSRHLIGKTFSFCVRKRGWHDGP
uniref:Uncharacterized protein n=1 Tax=Lepeophtheirus salmonis TaxID=72036 RepID=A0A0K2UZY2_LEPSM